MSDADLTDEVDRFVGGLSSDEPPRVGRRRKVKALPPPSEPDLKRDEDEEESEDSADRDASDVDGDDDPASLLPRELPRPAENQRSLGSLLSKYRVGEDPSFRVQLYRLLPKWLPGGIQGHGFLEEYGQQITEEYITSEFGGGTYEIRVMGPDPKTANGSKRYDSIKVEVAGAPNPERLSRSVRAKLDSVVAPVVGAPMQMMAQPENPGLATQALKMAADMAERERDERRRAEDKASSNAEHQRSMLDPIVDAERRRADEVLKSEREARENERRGFEERLREARDESRRLAEKVEAMIAAPQPNVVEQLKELVPMLKNDSGAAAAQAAASSAEGITKNILERQQIEVEALHKQHQTMLESLRQSHVNEITSMREAARREMDAERESSRNRETRHEEQLKVEREERRRDVEMYKRQADERDTQWRDRLEQAEINLKVQWESRVETQKTNYESQLQWARSEIEQLQARVRSFESQMADRGDLVKQLSGMRDLRSVAKDALGIEDPPPAAPSGGGIGLSGAGGAEGWQETIQTVIENLPAIWQTMNGGGGQQQPMQQVAPQGQQQPMQQQAAPPPKPGQIVQTEQGPMVVVQAPNGQLALAPKDQYDAFHAQQRTSRGQGGGAKPRGMLAQPKPSSGLPVPDMSIGLPKPRAWGEAVQPPLPTDQPQQQPPVAAAPQQAPQQRQRRVRSSQPQQGDGSVDPKTQMMIAKEVAKRVHESVEGGDEPEEFVQKMLSAGYPSMVIQVIAGMTDDEVLSGIKQAEPNSAGTTPRGQRFVHAALAALRAAI